METFSGDVARASHPHAGKVLITDAVTAIADQSDRPYCAGAACTALGRSGSRLPEWRTGSGPARWRGRRRRARGSEIPRGPTQSSANFRIHHRGTEDTEGSLRVTAHDIATSARWSAIFSEKHNNYHLLTMVAHQMSSASNFAIPLCPLCLCGEFPHRGPAARFFSR